jgi:hypothetical protein
MERLLPKDTDQEQIEKAFNLIKDCMAHHPEIEPTLWAGAVWSVLVDGYASSGMTHDQFTQEWDKLKHFYKPWFKSNQRHSG